MNCGSVLLIDDDPLVLESLTLALRDEGYEVATATGGPQAIDLCREQMFEVVVCDIRMPELNGIETLRAIKKIHLATRTIVITGYADDSDAAVEALRLGVDDYLLKPFDDQLLLHSLAQHVERFRLAAENTRLNQELREANALLQRENSRLKRQTREHYKFDQIIGSSAMMGEVYRLLEPVIDSEITVLFTGETGTGKELFARALHYNGPRQGASFVPVHCGALQESLLESELFGVIPNYPGLHSPTGKKGLFEEADGGTLFLDEIGEMSPAMQVKLLRVLQDGEIQRVGDTLGRRVDVRVLVATNRRLEEEVEQGRFRQDLFYRLTGVEIPLPPLRERGEDIPLLVRHFLDLHGEKTGYDSPVLAPEALALLQGYAWPGNVRELEKELARAATLANGAESILPEHFSARLCQAASSAPSCAHGSLSEVERRHILQVLQQSKWSIQRTAETLGIHRNTLTRKMAEHGLHKNNS